MFIDITQYRITIGVWFLVSPLKQQYILILLIKGLIYMLLMKSGDVHPNPGPITLENQSNVPQLKICHFNARSLMAPDRLDMISQQLTIDNIYDIICVSETHIDNTVLESDVQIPSYNNFRKDRTRHGGGVCCYVNDYLVAKRRVDLEIDSIELIWIEIKLKNSKMLVGTCYRPPGMSLDEVENFISQFQDSLNKALAAGFKQTVILGDFNDRCLTWTGSHEESELRRKLVYLADTNKITQIINEPTRGPNLLDLIFISSNDNIVESGTDDPPDPSLDHDLVFVHISTHKNNCRTCNRRRVWKYDDADF